MPRLLNINSYHYRRGGADAVYFDHAELMQTLGWDTAFFAMHHPENDVSEWSKYFVDEIEFGNAYSARDKLVKASKVVWSFEAQRRLEQLIGDFKPDVAHLHNIYHHLSPSILSTLKQAGIPVVLTAHDLKLACPQLYDVHRRQRLRKMQRRQLLKHGSAPVCARFSFSQRSRKRRSIYSSVSG